MSASRRFVTIAGVSAVLFCFAALLITSYSLVGYSDPTKWYTFARDFGSSFGTVPLAYGFPLLQAAAIAVVGPFYGFIVNVPLLVILAGLVFAFGWHHVVDPDGSSVIHLMPSLIGAGALSFLIAVDWEMWLHLVNPYRDPLSHLMVITTCVVLVAWSRRKRDTLVGPIAIGTALAWAISSRETAVFMLAPVGLYAIASKISDPDFATVRDATVFFVALVVASVPLLIQNALLSGNPVMPAQMLRGLEQQQEFVPGIRFEHFADTLPAVLDQLATQYGAAGLLVLVGIGVSIRYRIAVALYMSLPAMLIHIGFYGAYARAVPRYLIVVDLFAAPLAGIAIAWVAGLGLRFIDGGPTRNRLALGAIALGFLPGVVVPVVAMMNFEPHFQLEQARRLRADLIEFLPPGASVMGERPYAEIVQCFAGDRLKVDHRPLVESRLHEQLGRSEVAYVLTREPVGGEIASRFEFARLAVFRQSRYQIGPFWLYEVRAALGGPP